MTQVLIFIGGLIVGALLLWPLMRSRQQLLQQQVSERERQLEELRQHSAAEREQLAGTFAKVSQEALRDNSDSFMRLAKSTLETLLSDAKGEIGKQQESIKGTVEPLSKALDAYDRKMQDFENQRSRSLGELFEKINQMREVEGELRRETAGLADALRKPQVRGQWGELALRRSVELAGMSGHCVFEEQVVGADRERPDLIVSLPGGRKIIVDAKAVLIHYLDAEKESDPVARQELLRKHAAAVRERVKDLSSKSYQNSFEGSADFVVLFIPQEGFYAAALDADSALLEDAVTKNVFIASPTILITLLRAVALGWREEQITANAREISQLGSEIYDRVATWLEHYVKVGKALDDATGKYNESVASLEMRVLVTARKLREKGISGQKEIPATPQIEKSTRTPTLFDDTTD
ncbi:MAG: DNA recombination protein RmuC [bacterium]